MGILFKRPLTVHCAGSFINSAMCAFVLPLVGWESHLISKVNVEEL